MIKLDRSAARHFLFSLIALIALVCLYVGIQNTLIAGVVASLFVIGSSAKLYTAWLRSPKRGLAKLASMQPTNLNALNAVHRTRRCKKEALAVLRSQTLEGKLIDLIHDAYSQGVDAGFIDTYAAQDGDFLLCRAMPREPVARNSAYLKKAYQIGLCHGESLRQRAEQRQIFTRG